VGKLYKDIMQKSSVQHAFLKCDIPLVAQGTCRSSHAVRNYGDFSIELIQ
jgi:hypothetical protein